MPFTKTGDRWREKMKRLLKLRKKNDDEKTHSRITNDTVAEHREQVLAGGRRFKYPLQYQKHKLVFNSILIGIVAIVMLGVFSWQQLYVVQNASKLMYRLTQIVPVSVASVDGESVRYSDYLLRYRGSIHYYQQHNSFNANSVDGKRQSEYTKRQDLNKTEKIALARKIARENRISVSNKEVNEKINLDISTTDVSLEAYEKTVLKSYYDWSLDEYRDIVRAQLLSQKVNFAIDAQAKNRAYGLRQEVTSGADFATVAKRDSDDEGTIKLTGGDSGRLLVKNQDANGLVVAAQKLDKDQVSDLIKGTDAYYIIKLISKDNESVQFLRIKIKLSELDKRFVQLRKDGKIEEFISVQQ